jgi:hypothetical protein
MEMMQEYGDMCAAYPEGFTYEGYDYQCLPENLDKLEKGAEIISMMEYAHTCYEE